MHPSYATNPKLGWCLGAESLINLDELNCVKIIDLGRLDDTEFWLQVFFRGSNNEACLDSYNDRFSCEKARAWLRHLLKREISKEDWQKGRHDESFREGVSLQ